MSEANTRRHHHEHQMLGQSRHGQLGRVLQVVRSLGSQDGRGGETGSGKELHRMAAAGVVELDPPARATAIMLTRKGRKQIEASK